MNATDSKDDVSQPKASELYFVGTVILILFCVTQLFYWAGCIWAPSGTKFDGFTGMVADQNMYYSFIRQAEEGKLLFVNRLTHIPHRPAMLNLEWLAVGWMSALIRNESLVYALWRLFGISALLGAFWWLLSLLPTPISRSQDPASNHSNKVRFRRRVMLLLCAFSGGFGWIFEILDRIGLTGNTPLNMLDTSDALCSPFSQMLFNPHLSLTHGLSLVTLGTWVRGEQTRKISWYGMTGAIAFINGLMRPYDLIVLWVAIPLFIFSDWTVQRTRHQENSVGTPRLFAPEPRNRFLLRLLPLGITAPVLIYYFLLFQYHPVFKYWASQGVVAPLAIHWHWINLGMAGLFFGWRLIRITKYPLTSSTECVLMVWIIAALLLFHAHQLPFFAFMPYTPLLGSTLMSTMLLMSYGITHTWHWTTVRSILFRIGIAACLILLSSLSSVVWSGKISRNLARLPEHYISLYELAMHEWLRRNGDASDVVLSTPSVGNRLAKEVSGRFVVAHVNVTPHYGKLSKQIGQLYRGEMKQAEVDERLREWDVRWIVVAKVSEPADGATWESVRKVRLAYENEGWQIFERNK